MSYHLNIHPVGDLNSKLELKELLSLLRKKDATASIIESESKAKEFRVENSNIGRLYFSNGLFWSLYESEIQLNHLIDFLEPLGLILIGEEGETYSETKDNAALSSHSTKSEEEKFKFGDILSQRKIGFFIIALFFILAWIIK